MARDTAGSGKAPDMSVGALSSDAMKQIKSYAERIGNLLDEKAETDASLKEVFKEAGDAGFDTKILRKAVKLVRRKSDEAKAEQDMIDLYVHAIQPDQFDKAA